MEVRSSIPRVLGHAFRTMNGASWCDCGTYFGGWAFSRTSSPETMQERHSRYHLHLIILGHKKGL